MAVLKVKNEKGEFVEVPYFITESGGGGTGGGGGSAAYEQVVNYATPMGSFGSYSVETEKAQKLVDASEIYLHMIVGPISGAPSDFKLKLKFCFANLYELVVDRIYERSVSGTASGPEWFVKLTKLPSNKYVVDDCFYTTYYDADTDSNPVKTIESRHFLGSNNMASGSPPSFNISAHFNTIEETNATVPSGGVAITIWAR